MRAILGLFVKKREVLTVIIVCVVQTANEETKEHLYETLLAECRDTIQAVREELKSEAVRRYCRLKLTVRWRRGMCVFLT